MDRLPASTDYKFEEKVATQLVDTELTAETGLKKFIVTQGQRQVLKFIELKPSPVVLDMSGVDAVIERNFENGLSRAKS